MNEVHDTTIELDVEVEYSTEIQEADPEVGLPNGGIAITIEAVYIKVPGKVSPIKVNITSLISQDQLLPIQEEIQEAEQQEYESQFS